MQSRNRNKGFTLVELITAIAILGAVMLIGIPTYVNFRQQVVVGSEANQIVEYFREGLARADSQQEGSSWAFSIVNGASDYYALVQDGATTTPLSVHYLDPGAEFTATSTAGLITITGGPTLSPLSSGLDITISSPGGDYLQRIVVDTNGKITRTRNY
jgi:prepilin-type N-terminal cleavage/methylation domain-containing protein